MQQEHVQELLLEYLDKTLPEIQRKEVEAHLKQCARCADGLTQLKTVLKAFEKEIPAVPSDSIRTDFLRRLAIEKQHVPQGITGKTTFLSGKSDWVGKSLKIAAGLALLIGSFLLGKYDEAQKSNAVFTSLQNESNEIRETAIFALLENKSASRRIQGVNFIEEIQHPDETIVKALADRMLYDENKNVRLAAVAAVSRFTSSELAKNGLIAALATEKDPGIQLALIHSLVKIQEKKARLPMQRLLEQEETQPFVKAQIQSLLPSII
jgi:HEAT repeat protein